MAQYIAILRGINVSGQKAIKMADLKQHFEMLGFEEVQTYIQSGNIIFNTQESSVLKLVSAIENMIRKTYGFEVPVIVKSKNDLKFALSNNPFMMRGEDSNHLYITFLAEKPASRDVKSIDSTLYFPEEFQITKDIIFFFSPNGYGKAKMNNNFFENKLKVTATTRNWKTVNKLYDLATS